MPNLEPYDVCKNYSIGDGVVGTNQSETSFFFISDMHLDRNLNAEDEIIYTVYIGGHTQKWFDQEEQIWRAGNETYVVYNEIEIRSCRLILVEKHNNLI